MAPPTTSSQEIDAKVEQLWADATTEIANINPATENWKSTPLPLARIKKIMKTEEDINVEMERDKHFNSVPEGAAPLPLQTNFTRFMIAGEAPVLLGKACELMIREMSVRAWRHTERNRRRTLQKQDIHAAVGESEVFDFLVDIVPRVSTPATMQKVPSTSSDVPPGAGAGAASSAAAPLNGQDQQQQQQHHAMSLSDAEARYAQLQEQMQEQYLMTMHRPQGQLDASSTLDVGQQHSLFNPQLLLQQHQPHQNHLQQQQQQQQQHQESALSHLQQHFAGQAPNPGNE